MNDEFQSGDSDEQGRGSSQSPINDGKSGQIPFDQPEQTQHADFTQHPDLSGSSSESAHGSAQPQPSGHSGDGYHRQAHAHGHASRRGKPKAPPSRSDKIGTYAVYAAVYGPFVVGFIVVVAILAHNALVFHNAMVASHVEAKETSSYDFEIYEEGEAQLSTTSNAYRTLRDAFSSSVNAVMYTEAHGSTDTDDVERLKQYATEFKDASKQFGKVEAVSDEAVKQVYVTYMDQAIKFAAVATEFADSAIPLSAAVNSCSQEPTEMVGTEAYYAQYDEYVKACRSGLEAANELPVEAMSTYVGAMNDYLNQLSKVVDEMKTIGTSDSVVFGTQEYTRFYELEDEYYDQVGQVSPYTISSQLYNNLNSKMDEADPSDELNALDDQLQKSWADSRR